MIDIKIIFRIKKNLLENIPKYFNIWDFLETFLNFCLSVQLAWFWPTNNTIVEIDLKLSLSFVSKDKKLYNLGDFLGQENKAQLYWARIVGGGKGYDFLSIFKNETTKEMLT